MLRFVQVTMDPISFSEQIVEFMNINTTPTAIKIAGWKKRRVAVDYEKDVLCEEDLTERTFLLNAAYLLPPKKRLQPDFDRHILPLIKEEAPVFGTDYDYEGAISYSSFEFEYGPADVPNVLVAAYMSGLAPEPRHFEALPPSQVKAWTLAAAFVAGLPPHEDYFAKFAGYAAESGDFVQVCEDAEEATASAKHQMSRVHKIKVRPRACNIERHMSMQMFWQRRSVLGNDVCTHICGVRPNPERVPCVQDFKHVCMGYGDGLEAAVICAERKGFKVKQSQAST